MSLLLKERRCKEVLWRREPSASAELPSKTTSPLIQSIKIRFLKKDDLMTYLFQQILL